MSGWAHRKMPSTNTWKVHTWNLELTTGLSYFIWSLCHIQFPGFLFYCFLVFLCVSPFVLPTSVPSCVPSPVSTCLSPSASCHSNYLLLPPCALLLFLLSVGSRPMEVLSNGRPTHPQEENVLRKTWFQTRLIPGITALNVIAVSRSWRRSFKDKGCWNLASLYFREELEKKIDLFWVSEGESRCSWVILFFYLFNRIIPFFLVSSLQKSYLLLNTQCFQSHIWPTHKKGKITIKKHNAVFC